MHVWSISVLAHMHISGSVWLEHVQHTQGGACFIHDLPATCRLWEHPAPARALSWLRRLWKPTHFSPQPTRVGSNIQVTAALPQLPSNHLFSEKPTCCDLIQAVFPGVTLAKMPQGECPVFLYRKPEALVSLQQAGTGTFSSNNFS